MYHQFDGREEDAMKKQTVTRVQVLLKRIAMIMVFVMTITCMDLYVPATTGSSSQEATMKVETEIETTSHVNGEVSSKSVLNQKCWKANSWCKARKNWFVITKRRSVSGENYEKAYRKRRSND